jgi:hypothetical protein
MLSDAGHPTPIENRKNCAKALLIENQVEFIF